MVTRRTWTLLLLSLVACASLATAQERAPTRESLANLERDERLARPVTLNARRIYLGDLLERVSKLTGVRLEAAERVAPISGYQLTVALKERPAWQVLDGIARLYHYPPDRWFWVREERAGQARYVLKNTLRPDYVNSLRERLLEDALVRHLRDREDQIRAGSARPRRLDAFFLGLPEEALRAAFRGRPVHFPVDRLTPEQRRALEELTSGVQAVAQSGVSRLPDARAVQPVLALERSSFNQALPTLGLRVGSGGFSTWTGYSSELTVPAMRQVMLKNWLGDGETSAAPDRRLETEKPGASSGDEWSRGMADEVEALAQKAGVDLLFDLPQELPSSLQPKRWLNLSSRAESLAALLSGAGSERLFWKRRGDLYLLRLTEWMWLRRDTAAPWPVVRTLRASARANGGYLTLDDWQRLARLSREQRTSLSSEFGDANREGNVERTLPILLTLPAMTPNERAALEQPEGIGWNELRRSARTALVRAVGPERAPLLRLHLSRRQSPGEEPVTRFYVHDESLPRDDGDEGPPSRAGLWPVRWLDPEPPSAAR